MKVIEADELYKLLQAKDKPVLINVLRPDDFNTTHIDGSINIPVRLPGFDKEVQEQVPDRDKQVVVHCSGPN